MSVSGGTDTGPGWRTGVLVGFLAQAFAVRAPVGAPAEGTAAASAAADANPLSGTTYTGKVRQQLRQGDLHSFPLEVDNFAGNGKSSTIVGGDGVTRTKVELPGGYRGRTGHFEWIIEPDKRVNHRIFVPDA